MKGIRGDISRSSKDVKFNASGLSGKPILLALEQLGKFPFFRFESQVMQIHSVALTLSTPIRQDLSTSCEHALYFFCITFNYRALVPQLITTSAYIFWATCNVFEKQMYHGNCISIFVVLCLHPVTAKCFT